MAKKKRSAAELMSANFDIKPAPVEESAPIINTSANESEKLQTKPIKKRSKVQQPDAEGRIRVTCKVNPYIWDHLKMYANAKGYQLPEALDAVLLAFFNQRKGMDLAPLKKYRKSAK